MKKILVILFAVLLVVSACTQEPQERPIFPTEPLEPNEINDPIDSNKPLETDKSAIYEVGNIKNCKITANVADVKSGAGNTFNSIGTLKKDDIIKVLGQIGDWYVVRMDNNQVGAIDSKNATPIVKEGEDAEFPQEKQPQTPQLPTEQAPDKVVQQPNQEPTNENAPTGPVEGLSAQEQQMVDLANQERRKNSLPALSVDLEVARVAEIKSQDMVDSNYFSHNSPNYGIPFDMMKSFGIEYLSAGENLAGNSTVERAHNALMNSSGHRKNILHPDFTHIGVGIKPSPKYGYIFTQMFINKR